MRRGGRERDRNVRATVADAAARIVVEEGVESLTAARDKAVRRLGLEGLRDLPTPREIEQALVDYQRLFGGDAHLESIDRLRRHALEAMRLLAQFDPRLVGPVLSGTASGHSPVTLHVFADRAEDVGLFLDERGIPAELSERRIHPGGEAPARNQPCFSFVAGGIGVDLLVFPVRGLRQAPPSAIDGRPMQRATLADVEALIAMP